RAPALPGHALTPLSTARGSGRSGRYRIGFDALESAPFVENRPGDAGQLVGERNRQHVVVQALFGGLDPGLEPIALPMLWPDLDQHDPGRLDEQSAQIAIAALRDAAKDRAVSSRDLLRDQSEPGTKVAAFCEGISSADCGHHRARDDRADARHRHQPLTPFVVTGQRCNLVGYALDALIEPAPTVGQSLDDLQHAWRKDVGAFSKDARQLGTQEA